MQKCFDRTRKKWILRLQDLVEFENESADCIDTQSTCWLLILLHSRHFHTRKTSSCWEVGNEVSLWISNDSIRVAKVNGNGCCDRSIGSFTFRSFSWLTCEHDLWWLSMILCCRSCVRQACIINRCRSYKSIEREAIDLTEYSSYVKRRRHQ